MNIRKLVSTVVLVVLAGWCWLAAPVMAQEAAAELPGVKIDGDYGYWFPPDVSVHGHKMDALINLVHAFGAVLFVGWGIYFAYCLIRFRSRPGSRAIHASIRAKPAKYVEVGVVVFEAVLMFGFAIPIWASVKNDIPPPEDNPLRIRVLAEQFNWNFHYAGADGVFGPTAPEFIDEGINAVGVDRNHPDGADDIISGVLSFPVDRPIICEISSKDVIHSFAIPVMRVKQDAIPGMRIPVWFQATKTGTYQVACAQLCGNNHYKMLAPMVIRTPEEFEAWLEEKGKPPEVFNEDDFED